MPSGSLGQLTVDLAANITRFESALNKAERQAQRRSRGIQRTFTRLAGGIGIALSSIGFTRLTQQSLEYADSIGKTADKLGVSTSALQEYRFAAEQTGVQQRALDLGLQRFTRRVAEAANGQGELKGVIAELGIELRNADGTLRSSEDVLADYADAIKNAATPQEQLRLAFKGFDSEGAALVNTLRNGSEGLNAYRREAREAGLVIEQSVVRNAEAANDALNRLGKVIQAQTTTAFVSLAPAIEGTAAAIENLVNGRVSELPETLQGLGFSAVAVDTVVSNLGKTIGGFAAVVSTLVTEGIGPAQLVMREWRADIESVDEALQRYADTVVGITPPAIGLGGGGGGLGGDTNVVAAEEGPRNPVTGLTDEELEESNARQLSAITELARNVQQIDALQAQERIANEQAVVRFKEQASASIARNFSSLLRTLGQENKNYARAAIVIEKGLAIAQAQINTAVAVTKALSIDPTGTLAARVQFLGGVQQGLIAATGLAELAAVNRQPGGGASLPAPTATFDADPVTGEPIGAGTQGTLTINVNGVITEEVLQDLVIPALQDATDRDVVLFRGDSAQADIIRRG